MNYQNLLQSLLQAKYLISVGQWGTTDVAPTHIQLLIFSANSKRLLKSFGKNNI